MTKWCLTHLLTAIICAGPMPAFAQSTCIHFSKLTPGSTPSPHEDPVTHFSLSDFTDEPQPPIKIISLPTTSTAYVGYTGSDEGVWAFQAASAHSVYLFDRVDIEYVAPVAGSTVSYGSVETGPDRKPTRLAADRPRSIRKLRYEPLPGEKMAGFAIKGNIAAIGKVCVRHAGTYDLPFTSLIRKMTDKVK